MAARNDKSNNGQHGDTNRRPRPVEENGKKGRIPSDKMSDQEDQDNLPPSQYYPAPLYSVLLELVASCIIFAVTFIAPSSGTAVITSSDGSTYIGLLRECTSTECYAWMSTSSSSSTTAATSSTVTARSTTSTTSLAQVYLVTGLALLCTFWLSVDRIVCLFIRVFSKPPEHIDADKGWWPRTLSWIKVRAYDLGLLFLPVLLVLVFSVAISAVTLRSSASDFGITTASIGVGVYLLIVACLLLLPSVVLDWFHPRWMPDWTRRTKFGLTCFGGTR